LLIFYTLEAKREREEGQGREIELPSFLTSPQSRRHHTLNNLSLPSPSLSPSLPLFLPKQNVPANQTEHDRFGFAKLVGKDFQYYIKKYELSFGRKSKSKGADFCLGRAVTPGVSDWLLHGPYRLSSIEPCFDCKRTLCEKCQPYASATT
jgi:hypothetical protein